MKKKFPFIFFILSPILLLSGFDMQARVAFFLPEDHRLRHIYGKHGWGEYELEVSTPLQCCTECASDWDLFANLAYYQKRGHSSCLHDPTKVNNWAFNVGIKRHFDCFECVFPYVGIGVGAAHVRFHDTSDFVKRHINRGGIALLAKSGLKYDLTCNLFIDLFMDYSYYWFNFRHTSGVTVRNANTGGLKVGLGLGYQF